MADNPNNAELLSLLGQAREQVKFFGELGAESIGLDKAAALPQAVTVAAKADEPQRPSAPTSRQESVLIARAIPSSEPYVSKSTEPSQDLFDLAAPQPSVAQARETLEDVWRDVCTAVGGSRFGEGR